MTRVFVPADSAARSVGADDVAGAIARLDDVDVVRNGSRGMLWLEPMVEVDTDRGRIAYGPVTVADLPGMTQGLITGADHPLRLGPVDELPWMKDQTRLLFARVGVVDPLSTQDFLDHGGLAGLHAALDMRPEDVVDAVTRSGLRGRGGAGFPAGIKLKTVLDAPGATKFITCNADEGDSGTFADRMLMEGDPYTLIEGILIAARAVGATEGYIYIRSEYPEAVRTMGRAVDIAYAQGWLGRSVLGSDMSFDLTIRVGAGAYICGEETSMLESIEGKRGVVRAKPPLPAIEGLFGMPTVVNNVLTLGSVPSILSDGAEAYAALGTGRSKGTQVFQLAGNIARGGVFETAFGISLADLIDVYGGGTRSGRPIGAVQVGGPLGAYLPPDQLDIPLDYEAFAERGFIVGHGGIVVFDDTVDMARQARSAMEFCAEESCGKCTPCRIGSIRGVEVIDRIIANVDREANLVLLDELCEVMVDGSLCAMGGLTPNPVRSALKYWHDDFLN